MPGKDTSPGRCRAGVPLCLSGGEAPPRSRPFLARGVNRPDPAVPNAGPPAYPAVVRAAGRSAGTLYRLSPLGESFANGPLAQLARWAADNQDDLLDEGRYEPPPDRMTHPGP
ncbi:hypothetical protein GCM10017673_31370 [Streptosporangium violaceochromogenes]|nr:hypothetical protein GCM10017673_31370 [Streptosporangium violaceochromogenes]